MPITLRDLTPLLTPYNKPQDIDLSGFAETNLQHQQMAQSRAIADQQDATNRARIAEDARKADMVDKLARDAAAAAAARKQFEDRQAFLGRIPETVDPSKQRAFEAQAPGVGFDVRQAESSLNLPTIPALEMPLTPGPNLQGPSASFKPSLYDQPEADRSVMFTQPDVRLESPLGMGPLSIGGVIGEQPAFDAGTITQGALIDRATGKEVASYDPSMARDREKMFVNNYFDNLVKTSPEIYRPAAEQARAVAMSELQANGYNAQAAIDSVMKNPEAGMVRELGANARSAMSASARLESQGLSGQRLDNQMYQQGSNRMRQSLLDNGVNKAVDARVQLEKTLTILDKNPNDTVAIAQALWALANSADPGAKKTDKDIERISGEAGLFSQGFDAINRWVNGVRPDQLARLITNMRENMTLTDQFLLDRFKAATKTRDMTPWPMGQAGEHRAIKSTFGALPYYSQWAEYDEAGRELEKLAPGGDLSGVGGGATVIESSSRRGVQPTAEDPGDWQDVPVVVE